MSFTCCFCVVWAACINKCAFHSALLGQTTPTPAPTRQLLSPSPPPHCRPTRPPQYWTGTLKVCVSERAFCFLGKVYTGLKSTSLFSSDSSSPNHQADPGSHGNSEVSDTPARTEQRCKRDSGVDDDVIDCFAACVLSHCQAVTTRLNSAEALLMVLVTFVLFLKSQIKTSAVTNTCCHVTWYVFLP